MRDVPRPGELERVAVDVGRMAAAIVAEGLGSAIGLRAKSSPTDIVTNIDEASETAIRAALEREVPGGGVLGEELGQTASASGLQWVVDPLDGTVNFSYGIPVFSVSIAAAVDGEIVAGAVVDAVRGDVFSAACDGPATRNGEPIGVSNCDGLTSALVVTGFSYQASTRAAQGEVVSRLLPRVRDLRCFGSAALNLCWIAAGWADAYFERDTKLWDFAAGWLIASRAGAVTELPCPENSDLVIAATPSIFEPLRGLVDSPRAAITAA